VRGGGQDFSSAKEPPAPRIEPGAVKAILREHVEDVEARVHAWHHAAPAHISKINCLDHYDQVFFESADVNVQLTHLQTLATVARHGSFSRAARELRLTQPAVSMQVRQLEQELGLPLLERVGKRTYTTKAGELLLAHAGRAMQELERGLALVQQLRGIVAGRIRLGTSASFSIYLLPSALRRFRARYPQTELVVVTGNAPEITRAVVANELDVGIVSLPVRERELVVAALHRDELVAIGPPRRRWPRPRATPADLAREPLILFERGATLRRLIDNWFQRGDAAPALPMELGNTEAIKKLVESGLGLSVTSWFAAKADVRARRLSAVKLAPPLFRQIGIVLRRDKPKTPVLDAFLGTLDDLRRSLD
jgi:DNA-binding transcriptional LysR family regulator